MDTWDTLNVPRGGQAKLLVTALRTKDGYQGPIRLRAIMPSDSTHAAGITVQSAVIPAGKSTATMLCTATKAATRRAFAFAVVGEAKSSGGRIIRRVAERKLFLADPQMVHIAWDWRVREVTAVVIGSGGSP